MHLDHGMRVLFEFTFPTSTITPLAQLSTTQDTIELHSIDVENENKELLEKVEEAHAAERRHDEARRRLDEYAEDIVKLQAELSDERARRAELAAELEALRESSASSAPPSRRISLVEGLMDSVPSRDAPTSEWRGCAELLHARVRELDNELKQSRRDAEREQHFLKEEVLRREQELEDVRVNYDRQQREYETELELVRIELHDTNEVG